MRFPYEEIRAIYIGLDLGQRRDYTALAVLAVTDIFLGREKVRYNLVKHTEYRILHLERFDLGTPYTSLPSSLRDVALRARQLGKVAIAVDATGPGLPVVEIIREAQLPANVLAVMITGAVSSASGSKNGFYNIARKELLSKLRVAIETRKLKTNERLPLKDELRAELQNLQVESASHARAHDDLVFAIALALWAATR